MENRQRILFYNDSAIFGGHEVMTLRIVRDLLQAKFSICFMFYASNQRLSEELELLMRNFESLTLLPTPLRSGHLQSIMSFFQWSSLYRLYRLVRGRFDLICASQGNIELSSKILIVARLAQIKLVSYIPGDFLPSELKLPLMWLRDKFARFLFRLPSAYISISLTFVAGLQRKYNVASNRVYLLENVLDKIDLPLLNNRCRTLPVRFLMVGAVNSIKNQQFMLDWLECNPNYPAELVLVGCGPLLLEMKQRVMRSTALCKRVQFYGWRDDTLQIMTKMDLLVLPSLVEGVPLVMLEAAALKLPMLATNAYGMADFLPIEMRFKCNDQNDFSRKLESLLINSAHTQTLIEQNYQQVLRYNDNKAFSNKISAIFEDLLNT